MTTRERVLYDFRGVDRRGLNRAGTVESARGPESFVRQKHRQGWRSLVVTRGGVEVGRIAVLDGRRTWWAES